MDNLEVKDKPARMATNAVYLSGQGGVYPYASDANILVTEKRLFCRYAQYSHEYLHDADHTAELLADLKKRGVDLFTFVQRSFMQHERRYLFLKENECIALLKISSFDNWWNFQANKKTRNLVRKAQKSGVIVEPVEENEDFARDVLRIYDETPIREGRRFGRYRTMNLAVLGRGFRNLRNSDLLGAYVNRQLIGFMWIIYGDKVAELENCLSLIQHRDKAPMNMLMAEAVRRCSKKGVHFLVYEKFGYLPGLDSFKMHNGFKRCVTTRYFVALSQRGSLAIKLKMHKDIAYSLSPRLTRTLLPIYRTFTRVIPSAVWQKQKRLKLLF
jgi:hypothetical protein